MFACAEIRSFLLNYYFHLMMRVGVKIQSTLTAAIYQKVAHSNWKAFAFQSINLNLK